MNPRPPSLKQLIIFFILTFIIGWFAWIPILASQAKWGAFIFLFSPAISAFLISGLTNQLTGIKDILRRYLLLKFHVKWYLLAFLLIPTLFLLAVWTLLQSNVQTLWLNSPWYFIAASFLYLMFINSGEEIGWRGFALPQLQQLLGDPLIASLVLGLIWGLWHLPQYFVPNQPNIPLIPFLLLIVGLSTIYTVVFNNTQGSLFFAVVLHASTDIIPRAIRIANLSSDTWWSIDVLIWISGVVLYILANKQASIPSVIIKIRNEQ